jgi:integrase
MTAAFRIFSPDDSAPAETLATFAQLYREHLQSRVASGDYSDKRFKGTMAYVDSFLGHSVDGLRIGGLAPGDAKQHHFTRWLYDNLENWKSGATRGDAIGAVLGCFNWLKDLDIHVPFFRPKAMRLPRTHRRAMRREHYRAVMKAARAQPGSGCFRAIFFLSWYCGVRLAEFRKLEPHEIDWELNLIRLPKEKNKVGRSTGKERIIGLGDHQLAFLRRLVRRMPPEQKYVFASPRGLQWSKDNLGDHFRRYRKAAGVPEPIKMAAVRHGTAVRILSDGTTSTKAVADYLGHANTRMVEAIYAQETRYDGDLIRDVAKKAGKVKHGLKKPALKTQPPKRKEDTPLFDDLE